VLQYWFFYPFDDWWNVHEGDWELVQVILNNATRNPMKITYAWHHGGSTFDWDDPKFLKMDGTHPAVFVARGSHASYWSSEPFTFWQNIGPLGIADGIGCSGWIDYMTPIEKTLVPTNIDLIGDPYVLIPISEETRWTGWRGRWGEVETFATAGDKGPSSPQFASVHDTRRPDTGDTDQLLGFDLL
jgi:hypothetical protein